MDRVRLAGRALWVLLHATAHQTIANQHLTGKPTPAGCPVHTISLPTAIVDGGGDATAGIVSMVSEALRRAGPSAPCIFFLPRLEAWALSQVRAWSSALVCHCS